MLRSLDKATGENLTNQMNITLGSLHIIFMMLGAVDEATWENLTNQGNIT